MKVTSRPLRGGRDRAGGGAGTVCGGVGFDEVGMWVKSNEVKKGYYWWAYGEGDKVIILIRKVLPSGELMYYRIGSSSMFQSLPRDTDRFWPIEAPELEE